MTLHDYARALRRSWWLVALFAGLGVVVAAVLAARVSPAYASQVTFFASTPSSPASNPLAGDTFGQQRVNTYVKLLSSGELASRIQDTTDTGLSESAIMREVQGKGDLNTVLFTATVQDSSARRSLTIARAVSVQFPLLVTQLEGQVGSSSSPISLDVVSGPSLNRYPVSPNKPAIVGIGLVLGLLLGLAAALLRALGDRSVRTVGDLEIDDFPVPVIGSIPMADHDAATSMTAVTGGSTGDARRSEAIRAVRTNLRFINIEQAISVVVVTSPSAGEGKSSTAVSLGATLAQSGDKVLLVEADLRRPRAAAYLGLENAVGLTSVLSGDVDIADATQVWGGDGLHVLASGPTPPNPSELLGSAAMGDLLKILRQEYDMVVIDTPPVLPVTDAVVASAQADGTVVVARYGKTLRTDFHRALQVLAGVEARVLGSVLNGIPTRGFDADHYGNDEYLTGDTTT